jgi:hypothetical protein
MRVLWQPLIQFLVKKYLIPMSNNRLFLAFNYNIQETKFCEFSYNNQEIQKTQF